MRCWDAPTGCLARRADVLALSFAQTGGCPRGLRATVTGNPVRPGIARLAGRWLCAAGRWAGAGAGAGRIAGRAGAERGGAGGLAAIAARAAGAVAGDPAMPRRRIWTRCARRMVASGFPRLFWTASFDRCGRIARRGASGDLRGPERRPWRSWRWRGGRRCWCRCRARSTIIRRRMRPRWRDGAWVMRQGVIQRRRGWAALVERLAADQSSDWLRDAARTHGRTPPCARRQWPSAGRSLVEATIASQANLAGAAA